MAPRPETAATFGGRIWPSSAYRLAAATTSPLRMASSKTCDMLSSGPSLARALPARDRAAARMAKRKRREACIANSFRGLREAEYEPGPAHPHCRPRRRMLDYAPAGEGSATMTDEQVVW